MGDEPDPATRSLRAMAHPLRLQMLSLLTGAELSAAEVARELDISHANASYHLRLLLEAGQLEIAAEERIRGGVAKRYRHPWREHAARGKATPEDRQAWAQAMAAELVRRVGHWAGRPGHFTDAELWVTEEDYAEILAAIAAASTRIHGASRPPHSEGTIKVALTAALFEMRPS